MSNPRARMFYLHALTAVHSGTGQAAAVIDLPIAREKATGWPMIPASSLKGVLRAAAGNGDEDRLFGTEKNAGALCFGDQRILCLPIRSFFGTFAYITSPLVLTRLVNDFTAFGLENTVGNVPAVHDTSERMVILVVRPSALQNGQGPVYLEDLDLEAEPNADAAQIASKLAGVLFKENPAFFTSRFGVVSDEVFNFLCETGTEVVARIALNEKGTTTGDGGNLWYEEAVPAEAIFCGPLLVADHFRDSPDAALNSLANSKYVQIGGKSSVGRGLCRVVVAK